MPRSNNDVEVGSLTAVQVTTSAIYLTPDRYVLIGADFLPSRDIITQGSREEQRDQVVGVADQVVGVGLEQGCDPRRRAHIGGGGLRHSGGIRRCRRAERHADKIGYIQQQAAGPSSINEEPVLAAWAKWVNAHGGVAGHPVQILFDVDPNNVAVAVTDVQKLIADGVVAIVDADANNSAWAQYTENAGVPVLLSTNTLAFG